jgi:acyl-CoA thioester hydrolase
VRRVREPGSLRVVETDVRVRYSETDQMGTVYHAQYLVWFEIGRTEWCRSAGLPYAEMEQSGLFIPVTRVECAYRRRSRYDDPVRIRTRMTALASRGCAFAYEARGGSGVLLADGATRHVFTDPSGQPRSGPEDVLALLERFRVSKKSG